LAALDRGRYEVVPVGIARDGRWILAPDDPGQLAIAGGELPSVEAMSAPGTEIAARLDPATRGLVVTAPGDPPRSLGEVDVVLPLLHGAYGEDGTLQRLLEMAGGRCAGAGVSASGAGRDKEYMKLIFAARGLPVGRYVVVRDRDWRPPAPEGAPAATATTERKRVLDDISELGWPVFVKPARGGARIRTTPAPAPAPLGEAGEPPPGPDPQGLRGGGTPGTGGAGAGPAGARGGETGGAVRGGPRGCPPAGSVPAEVLVGGGAEFYDFQAKSLEADPSMATPPPIPAEAIAEVRRLACAAFEALSGESLARVDFFYTPDGPIILNEINTMPRRT